MNIQLSQPFDFNQMLVSSVFWHLLILTVVLFLPKPVFREDTVVPALMVNLVSEPRRPKIVAQKRPRPVAETKTPRELSSTPNKKQRVQKKTTTKELVKVKKTAVAIPQDLNKREEKIEPVVAPLAKKIMEDLAQLEKLETKFPPAESVAREPIVEEAFRELDAAKNKNVVATATSTVAESTQKNGESWNPILQKFDSLSVNSEPIKVKISSARLDHSSSFQSKLRALPTASQATTQSAAAENSSAKKAGAASTDDARSLYVGMIRERIYKNWQEPLAEEHDRETIVSFRIFPGGNIDKSFIKKSSGVDALDTLAVHAILDSAPFPEFPEQLKLPNLFVNMHFKYVPKDR